MVREMKMGTVMLLLMVGMLVWPFIVGVFGRMILRQLSCRVVVVLAVVISCSIAGGKLIWMLGKYPDMNPYLQALMELGLAALFSTYGVLFVERRIARHKHTDGT